MHLRGPERTLLDVVANATAAVLRGSSGPTLRDEDDPRGLDDETQGNNDDPQLEEARCLSSPWYFFSRRDIENPDAQACSFLAVLACLVCCRETRVRET